MNKFWLALVLGLALAASPVRAEELLPGPVLFELKEAERLLTHAEEAVKKSARSKTKSEEHVQAARIHLDAVRAKMGEIEQKYAGEFSPFQPEMVEARRRLLDLEVALSEKALAEGEGGAAGEEVAGRATLPAYSEAYWRARLRPFVVHPSQPDFDPAQYLDPHATSDPEDMQRRLQIYSQAALALTEFRQTHYGVATPLELRKLALDIENALRRFGLSCLQHADKELSEADGELQRLEQFVLRQNQALAAGKPVELLNRDDLQKLEAAVARAARLVQGGDACIKDLRDRLAALKRDDARLRQESAADTRMKPHAFAGSDAISIQQEAARAVQAYRPGTRLLKVVVVSPEWREESLVEWGDYQQSNLQQRVVRRVAAQVAARTGADVWLYSVEVRQLRLPSGIWGPLTARVQFADSMLEANVP